MCIPTVRLSIFSAKSSQHFHEGLPSVGAVNNVSKLKAFLLSDGRIKSMDFKGKTALVTGASRGIGKAIAEQFLAKGAKVIGVSTGMNAMITADKNAYLHVQLDLTDVDAYSKIVNSLPERFKNVDILVNNAGIKMNTEFATSTVSDWDKTMDVNLRSAYFLTQAVYPMLAKHGQGRVINIASQSGVAHVKSSIEYGLSKAGLIYLTKSLARALAKDGITVNAVSPGRTYTDMTSYGDNPDKLDDALKKIPLNAINTPEEIATAVLYFASDAAHNITGQILGIDGGEAIF